MWNKDLQKSVINYGSLIRFYWNHCIAIMCVFKLDGGYMSISRRVKWNATSSICNIMASNYRSEFHFYLRDRSEDFFTPPPLFQPPLNFPPPIINFWKIPPPRSPSPRLFDTLEYLCITVFMNWHYCLLHLVYWKNNKRRKKAYQNNLRSFFFILYYAITSDLAINFVHFPQSNLSSVRLKKNVSKWSGDKAKKQNQKQN